MGFFFFSKKRTAYEMPKCVEFRRVLFRPHRLLPRPPRRPRVAVFKPPMYRFCSIVGGAAGGGEGGACAGTGGGGKESLCVTVSWYATTVITITNPSNIADHSSNS